MQAHMDRPGNKRIGSNRGGIGLARLTTSKCVFVCLIVVLLASSAWAQAPEKSAQPTVGSPHYTAAITGDKVRVRSGPGTNYYECGRLNSGDTVEVKGTQAGWSRIVPPPGSFSWISMKYISINGDEPSIGILTGDGVVAYAGSDYEEPMHSTTEQVTLKRGVKVTLLNEEKDGYFKIVPPKGSDLWVSSNFLKREASKPQPPVSTPPSAEGTVKPVQTDTEETTDVPKPSTPATLESELLKQYKKLQEDIKTEKAKPLAEQDYASVKKALAELAAKQEAGQIARAAGTWLKHIELFEFGIGVAKQLKQQDQQLALANTKIQTAKSQKLAGLKKLGRYAVIGILRPSSVYGTESSVKRYRIVDEKGKTRCYVKPVGAALATDMTPFFGQKVGLIGTIKAYPAAGGAIVEFTSVKKLN
jgi:uncharacterized protein YgiM (DUF1202 family)